MTASNSSTRWQSRAMALAEQISPAMLQPEVLQIAEDRIESPEPWVVALSGGSDSVALALLMWAHWPQRRDRIVLAHFNHNLRGEESQGDAKFCAELGKGLKVTYAGGRWETPDRRGGEDKARTARNAFFKATCNRYKADVLITGHQRDDVAETLFMRLARGSGIGGLAAPRPIQPWRDGSVRWRPLLNLTRRQLRDALQAADVPWREDTSNFGEAYFRNRVRANVLPAWVDASGRDALAGAARSRELLQEDDDALDDWLEEIDPITRSGSLQLDLLDGKPKGLWRRALYAWLQRQDNIGDLSRQGFEVLLEQARTGRATRFSLGTEGFARIRRGRLYFEKLRR